MCRIMSQIVIGCYIMAKWKGKTTKKRKLRVANFSHSIDTHCQFHRNGANAREYRNVLIYQCRT